MFNSLKKQNRLRLANGKTILIEPVKAGREQSAVSDPKELAAIDRAILHHDPLYIVQHANGCVYDVLVNRESSMKYRDGTVTKTPNGSANVRLYEQKKGYLFAIA